MPLHYIENSTGYPSQTYEEFLDTTHIKTQSTVTQRWILKDLKKFTNGNERPIDRILNLAIALTVKRFELPREYCSKMLHLCDVFKMDADIWSESPGLPWITYGVKTKGEIRDDPEKIRQVRKFWHFAKIGDDINFPDCCPFLQANACQFDEHKVRVLWRYPATVTFGEAVFAVPFIRAYQNLPYTNSPLAYGMETSSGGEKKIKERFTKDKMYYTAIHFSRFDKTVPAWLIDIAFDILSLNMDFSHYENNGIPNARRMLHMYDQIKNYFINTTFQLANGFRFRKDSGIANGSYFTPLVGAVVNCILLQYAVMKTTRSPFHDAIFLGEDSLFSTSKPINLSEMSAVLRPLGMVLNIAKSQTSAELGNIKFRGYYINHGSPGKEEKNS